MKRRIVAILLVLAMAFSQLSVSGLTSVVYASGSENSQDDESSQTTGVERYFYNQLSDDALAQNMYKAMYDMYTKGIFKTGTQDYDLEANGYVTQDQIVAYTSGDSTLLTAMGKARDAFRSDYPQVFYVDFSYLSLRATKDKTGKYHAYLGTGRRADYFVEGFTSEEQVEEAITAFDKRVDEIVKGAQEVTASEEEVLASKQVEYVHNEIINTTSYRMEGVCDAGNEGFISTAYGSLVKGQAVCEGYAKAMKVILDKLGIPCLTVQGIVRWSENVPQAHMWNYVQVNGIWYGVDATWDDPVDPKGDVSTRGVDGYESSEYLMASDTIMNKCHVPSGIMSSVGYEFTYPELGLGELGFDKVISDRGLTAKYSSQGTSKSGLAAGVFEVSYNGMGYAKAAEQGKYILGKFYQYDPTTKEYVHGDWGYLDVKMYGYEYEEENDMIQDSDTKITLTLPHVQYVEFAVTDIAPTKYDAYTNTEEVLTTMTYQGDPLLFEAESGKIYNAKGNYVSAPYVESATPATTGRLKVGTTYPVTVTYDEKLVKTGSEVSFEVTSSGPTGAQYCKITDFKWDGDRTFTFNFTPSEMWADDSVYYDIQMTGVVGEGSEKVPNSIRYVASHGCVAFAYRSQGYDWNVFGKPSLLENVDFDTTDWTTSDSTKITDQLKNQLMLVTTKATETQADEMNTMIQQKLGTTVEKSESYNINLTLCKSQILNTGDGVRVSVGFPEGYSYDSIQNGVTFKAYHFKKNEQGEITGVEPIDCVVTQYGLVITCDSFSPFTIAAVEGNTDDVTEKTVIVSHTEGGTVSESVFKLSEGDSKTVNVQAEDGYQIESVKVGDQEQTIENPESMDLSISYDDITGESLIVDTQFIAETVLEKDEERDNASSEEHEHTVVTDPAEAPTCTKTGLTEGSHCSDCGEIIVAQEKVPATGHSYTYEDNGDNSHKATCSSGDLTVIQAHTYIDGVCRVCKAEVSKTYEVKWYIDGTESGTNTVKKGNIYSVKATDVEGKTFSHWSSDAEGSNKLSTSKTYTFYVSKNTTVYANYTTDKVEQQPIVSLSNTYAFTAGSKNYVRFESTRSIPSGYTVVEHGVIYGNSTSVFGKGKEDQLMRFTDESNKTLPAKVKKLVVSGTARNGMDYLNVSVGNSKNVTVYARGYIIVKNTTTNETTVMYSAVSSGSFNSLSE